MTTVVRLKQFDYQFIRNGHTPPPFGHLLFSASMGYTSA
jgi:hypothetical protein